MRFIQNNKDKISDHSDSIEDCTEVKQNMI